MRVGDVPAIPSQARLVGSLGPGTPMRLEIVLVPRHQTQLAANAEAVSTPGSATFRHYLRPGRFAAEYGASSTAIAAIEHSLAAEGLRPAGVDANRLAIRVVGTASSVEAAFGLELPRYRLPDGQVVFANNAAPRLSRSLAPAVTAVLGLDSLRAAAPTDLRMGRLRARPGGRARRGVADLRAQLAGPAASPSCTSTITGARAGLTADQLATAYGFDGLYGAGDTGTGTTIGLIEFAPVRPGDLSSFAACYGLGTPAVTQVPVAGGPGAYDGSSEVEAELDTELLIGLAPGASIIVYEGPNNKGNVSNTAAYDAESAAINADRAKVLSTSWGGCEPTVGRAVAESENVLFEQAALQGQTFVAASGDNGSEDCYGTVHGSAANQLSVDDPASQPFVTGVGGTTLSMTPVPQETVWNTHLVGPSPGAGGGGTSTIWPMPAYQAHSPPSLGVVGPFARCPGGAGPTTVRGTCREVPDVSANAGTPFATYCTIGGGNSFRSLCNSGGWTGLGGTSAAAPIWAALFALADSAPACATSGPVGFANPALYAIAGGPGYASTFRDVTSGSNDLTGAHPGRFSAAPGYDLASGLGTPLAGDGTSSGLVADLCAPGAIAARLTGLPRPTVTRVSPRSARSRGGAHVIVTGTNFEATTAVRFGTRPAVAFRVASRTRVVAVAPPGTGFVHVTVVSAAGSSHRSRADVFDYLTPPDVVSISPASGPSRGGTVVVIRGAWFMGVRSVRFGALPAHFVLRSTRLILAVAPPGSGLVDVRVSDRAGTSAPGSRDRFRYRG